MSAKIEVIGLTELRDKCARIARDTRPALEKATEKAIEYVHSQVPDYPPPPESSTYRRTGTLGRGITTEVRSVGNAIVGVIGNNVIYAPDVISLEAVGGRGPQTRRHKQTGWYTLQEVVRKAHDVVVNIYREAVQGLLGE